MSNTGSGTKPAMSNNGRKTANSKNAANSVKNYFDTQGGKDDKETNKYLKDILQQLTVLSNDITQVKGDISNMKNDMTNIKQDVANMKEFIKESIAEELAIKEQEWQNEKSWIQNRIERLEKREEESCRLEKKNNITIRGLQLGSTNIKSEVSNFLRETVEVDVNVIDAKSIKLRKGDNLVIAKLSCFDDKLTVMRNKKKLTGSEIYVNNDYTKKERDIQNQILKQANAEKDKNNIVKIGYRKLTVNNVTKRWKEGIGLVDENKPQTDNEAQYVDQFSEFPQN